MEILIKNAEIATMDKEKPFAKAALVRGGKFVLCGTEEECTAAASENAEVLDCGGKFVTPSFNDSHMHYLHYVKTKLSVNLCGATSVADIVKKMSAAAQSYDPKNGLWLVGEGWNQDYFTEGERRFPNRRDLDEVSFEHPVLIMRACYHIGVLNSRAMELMGLNRVKAKELGAFAETDENGEPTGIIRENYFDDVKSRLPYPGLSTLIEMMLKAQEEFFAEGITAVQSDDMKYAPEGKAFEMLKMLRAASLEGSLKLHYAEQALAQTEAEENALFEHDIFGGQSGSFKASCVKIISDGSLGARTALLKKPYADSPETKGIAIYTQEELDALVMKAYEHGVPAAIHAIGDGALEMCQRAFEKAQAAFPEKKLRSAIVHCQISSKEQVENFKKLGLIALTQPIFLDYDIHIVESRVGKELAESSYAFGDYMKLGICEAFGTDCPVEGFRPMRGIYCAVTRRDTKGCAPYLPEQAVSVYDALYAYTAAGAYVSGDENIRGKIKAGMEADFIIIDRNLIEVPAEEILSAKVLATYIAGERVYKL